MDAMIFPKWENPRLDALVEVARALRDSIVALSRSSVAPAAYPSLTEELAAVSEQVRRYQFPAVVQYTPRDGASGEELNEAIRRMGGG